MDYLDVKPEMLKDGLLGLLIGLVEKRQTERPIIIGHNVMYDLCFLYSTFLAPLPESLDEFKTDIHKIFPALVDTRVLMMDVVHRDVIHTDLSEVYKKLDSQYYPHIDNIAVWGYNQKGLRGSGLAHSAGYDSSSSR